jgi:hypothetical protein
MELLILLTLVVGLGALYVTSGDDVPHGGDRE